MFKPVEVLFQKNILENLCYLKNSNYLRILILILIISKSII